MRSKRVETLRLIEPMPNIDVGSMQICRKVTGEAVALITTAVNRDVFESDGLAKRPVTSTTQARRLPAD